MAELRKLHTGSKQGVAVVFIHGLGGDKIGTWMHESASSDDCWPHWLGQDSDTDVWTLGYDAQLSAWKEQAMPVPDQADQCADLLLSENGLSKRSLILIAHSLGGVVAKTIVVNCLTKDDPHMRSLTERIQAIVFIATPHAGSQLASLAQTLSWILRTNEQVGNLAQHDAHLRNLQSQFRSVVQQKGMRIKTYAETQGVSIPPTWWPRLIRWSKNLFPTVIVVNRTSAESGIAGVTTIPMAGDHFSICKPKDRHQQIHKSVLDFVGSLNLSFIEEAYGNDHPFQGGAKEEVGKPPGQLRGAEDRRLLPRDGLFYGRSKEVEQILSFLRDRTEEAAASVVVAGVGGVGKTEVCKAALRAWLREEATASVFYVELPDRANAGDLLVAFARSLGFRAPDSIDDLAAQMSAGLYYMDNVEGLAESADGRHALERIRSVPDVRILASSRVSIPAIMERSVKIDVLPDEAAVQLFRDLWRGRGELPPEHVLREFLVRNLGAHALSIALVARLGDSFEYGELVRRWRALGSSSVTDPQASGQRGGSLSASLQLTTEVLNQHSGALALWAAASLFATGLEDEDLQKIEALGGWSEARLWLVRHHILASRDGFWRVLPPVARFALDSFPAGKFGFNWKEAVLPVRELFSGPLLSIADKDSDGYSIENRTWVVRNFDTLHNLIRCEISSNECDNEWIEQVHSCLEVNYRFAPVQSKDFLEMIIPVLDEPALAIKILADIQGNLGNPDAARNLYERALRLCRLGGSAAASANVLHGLGNLEIRMGRPEIASNLLSSALGIFEKEGLLGGVANSLRCLGDLLYMQGQRDESLRTMERALNIYEKIGDRLGQANTLESLATVHRRAGEFELAHDLIIRSLQICENDQDLLGQANALHALGEVFLQMGLVEDARDHLTKSLAIYIKIHDGLGQANASFTMGETHMKDGDFAAAAEAFGRSLLLYKAEQAPFGQANSFQSLGDVELKQGKFLSANDFYQEALSIYERIRDPNGAAQTLAEIARCLRGTGMNADSEAAIRRAQEYADATDHQDIKGYVRAARADLGGEFEA